MDITAVFGTAIPGSSPGGSTKANLCGQGESNSRLVLGKDALYHLTMPAVRTYSHTFSDNSTHVAEHAPNNCHDDLTSRILALRHVPHGLIRHLRHICQKLWTSRWICG